MTRAPFPWPLTLKIPRHSQNSQETISLVCPGSTQGLSSVVSPKKLPGCMLVRCPKHLTWCLYMLRRNISTLSPYLISKNLRVQTVFWVFFLVLVSTVLFLQSLLTVCGQIVTDHYKHCTNLWSASQSIFPHSWAKPQDTLTPLFEKTACPHSEVSNPPSSGSETSLQTYGC